jgi:hypothetical protein
VSETLSRSEVLKARGYGEVSQNGSTPATAERECAICHGPVPVGRPKNSTVCGNPECREAWRLAQRRRRYADSRDRGETSEPAEVAETASDDGGEPSWGVLELLTRSRAEVLSAEIVLDGRQWTLTRNE